MSSQPLVLITGASAGIGAAVAKRFAAAGYQLALLARRIDKLDALTQELSGHAVSYEADVRSPYTLFKLIEKIEKDQGPIDVLVNNAGGVFGLEPAYEGKLDEWEQCIDTNIKGVLYCTRAVLPGMVKRNRGHLIQLGSIAGHYPYPGGNVYGATKAFVHQFSLNLRADLLGTQVRVTCIEPGILGGTEFSVVRFRGDQKKADQTYAHIQPLLPNDIAEVIYFCHALPAHVNVNAIEIMPVCQASGPLAIHRSPAI